MKTSQLQIRISEADKKLLRELARRAGLGLSEFVLSRALHSDAERFQDLCRALRDTEPRSAVLAELNDFLDRLSATAFERAVAFAPRAPLDTDTKSYVCAMIERAAEMKKKTNLPEWVREAAIGGPQFASSLKNLRLHLLLYSPVVFRRRNVFADSSVGDRV